MDIFEPVNLIQVLLSGGDDSLYLMDLLSTREDINNIADLFICELISNDDDKLRTYCIEVLARVNSKLLGNSEKFNLIIELIEWHTYEQNQPRLVILQIHAQNALTTIQ